MLYLINNKCYVNIAPQIYVEVIISEDGDITSTNNQIEVNLNTKIEQTTLQNELEKIKNNKKQSYDFEINKKRNKHRK